MFKILRTIVNKIKLMVLYQSICSEIKNGNTKYHSFTDISFLEMSIHKKRDFGHLASSMNKIRQLAEKFNVKKIKVNRMDS